MPRSIKRPQVGSIVWFYGNASPTSPAAAIVVNTDSKTQFDVVWYNGATGAATFATDQPFYDGGSRPASGTWITYPRVQENVAGKWPKDGGSEGPLGPGGVVVT